MGKRLNKTSICSVVFLDIVRYSELSIEDQSKIKKQFDTLLTEALKNTPHSDRIILDTGDGAAVAFLGAPEDAMFVSLNIRNAIHLSQNELFPNLKVKFGINLGPVRIINDINGHLNILGDGINVAQRIMSFAAPNQILVSRSYFEVTSRLSKEFTEIFSYSGLRKDKNIREHELYEIKDSLNITFHKDYESYTETELRADFKSVPKNQYKKYGAYGFFLFGFTLLFFLATYKNTHHANNHNIASKSHHHLDKVVNNYPSEGSSKITTASQLTTKAKNTSNKIKKKKLKNPDKKVEGSQQAMSDSSKENKVQKKQCTQGEIALHQCR